MSYLKRHGTRRVPQWAPLPGQAPNSAGGFAWAVDIWTRLRRFLILGSEGGSYYASEWSLTRENAQAVEACVREDGARAVAEFVRVSTEGRAPKNDPALYALALAAGLGDTETRRAALEALPQVARTGTHLFQFALFVEGFRGWGRSLRRAVGRWYAEQPIDALAYHAVKYRQRAGVAHRDLLRLAHPAARVGAGNPALVVSDEHARLFEWIVRGGETDRLPRLGGTDCALPMVYAQARGREIDTFVIYTDSETWAGDVHPAQALRAYRHASGIEARLVVVGMVSNGFSIADPNDPGMLDVVGFDTATPQLISDFARGAL